MNKKIAIIMGSTSDLPIMKKSMIVLGKLGLSFKVAFLSAHRTPEELRQYVQGLKEEGILVFLTGAGMSNALSGTVKAWVGNIPVIGVPLSGKTLDGIDSLLATLQMPPGIAVATVSIDGAQNAAILAAEILALNNEELDKNLSAYKKAEQESKNKKAEEALADLRKEFNCIVN
jgi:5-(carboxyamino)imidazole ribonucleotide mutase